MPPLRGTGDGLVVPKHLGDDEAEELLSELGVEARLLGQPAEPGDLLSLPLGVGRRHPVARLELPDLLGAGEPLRQQVHQCCVQVVDARAQPQQLGPHLVISRATAHTPDTSRVCGERIGAAIVRQDWAQFPPHVLREYALLADGERGALCGPLGDIAWMCAPRWDSDAVVSTLIGGSGIYAVTPTDPCVWGGSYEPGSLIWRNRWVTSDSIIECRDALAYPGDPDHLVLLRRVLATEHEARVRVVLDLRAEFGRRRTSRIKRTGD
ncbi:MAG: hypothetical protein QOI51_1279, partial [Nocardioidaceae bacterium]|nr:hypothetical protein [Nocardioidaceae bacterium]